MEQLAASCRGLLKERKGRRLEELGKCSNIYRPPLLKSLKLVMELGGWPRAIGRACQPRPRRQGTPSWPT